MGAWIMVPRTRYSDDFLLKHYYKPNNPCRQVVLLGAGMDSRAYRMSEIPEAIVFEVDQQTTFDVKEPLLRGEQLLVQDRKVVATDFSTDHNKTRPQWSQDLVAQGFDPNIPTVWLLEGLTMYLSIEDQKKLMFAIGELSPEQGGSAVFHDAISANYVKMRVSVSGANFIGGSDDYAGLWARFAGFKNTVVRNFDSIQVDRNARALRLGNGPGAFCTPSALRGQNVVLFVESEQ
jgi:methyltransferase (TIGR00027 family)